MSFAQKLTKGIFTATCLCVASFTAMADSYDEGLMAFVNGDYSKAEKYFEIAAKSGDDGAAHMLLRMHIEGKVKSNNERALAWNIKAAEAGSAHMQFILAERYASTTATQRDLSQAVHWYQQAAQQGHHIAMEKLARYYEQGKVVKQDTQTAQRLYSVAASEYDVHAQKGDPSAQNSLASLYENARGVRFNINAAVAWYKKAALQGYALAQYNIGRLLAEGNHVEQNIAQATYWLQLAADQGFIKAQSMLVKVKEEFGTSIAMR